jgi:hypothetical protein
MENITLFFKRWDLITWSWIISGLIIVMTLLDELIPTFDFAFIFAPFLVGWILLQVVRLTGIINKADLLLDRYREVLLLTLFFPIWSFLTIMIFGKDPFLSGFWGDKTPLEWSVFVLKKEGVVGGSPFGIISIIPFGWFVIYTFFKRFSDQSEKIDEILKTLNEKKDGSDKNDLDSVL